MLLNVNEIHYIFFVAWNSKMPQKNKPDIFTAEKYLVCLQIFITTKMLL